jgi:DNA-binding transcriptional ArsR family regulator
MAEKYVDADPRMLRAIAHPLRASLLYELYARGSATATDLAEAVGQPVNSVSFHLRQLAKYGLIEDDPDAAGADGRQRWWRPAMAEGLRVSDRELSQTKEGRAGLEVFRRNVVAHWQALVARFFAHHEDTGEVWASSDVPMLLSDEEAKACNTEVLAVLRKWHEHGRRTAPQEGQQRRTYLAMTMLMPHQTDLVD